MSQDLRVMTLLSLNAPASSFTLVTASANAFTQPTRAIYVDTAGTADWTDLDGNTSTAVKLVAGSVIAVSLTKVTALTSAVIYALR